MPVSIKGLFAVLATAAAFVAFPAQAGVVGTDEALAAVERERVKELVQRPELARELQALGVAPGDAAARVDAMSDAEVRELAGRLDALPAGGALTTNELLILVLVLILVALLI